MQSRTIAQMLERRENGLLRYPQCAKHIGGLPGRDIWCRDDATCVTVCDPNAPVSAANLGHYYCDHHAPTDSVPLEG